MRLLTVFLLVVSVVRAISPGRSLEQQGAHCRRAQLPLLRPNESGNSYGISRSARCTLHATRKARLMTVRDYAAHHVHYSVTEPMMVHTWQCRLAVISTSHGRQGKISGFLTTGKPSLKSKHLLPPSTRYSQLEMHRRTMAVTP